MKAIQLQRYDGISFNDLLSENIFEDCDPFYQIFDHTSAHILHK